MRTDGPPTSGGWEPQQARESAEHPEGGHRRASTAHGAGRSAGAGRSSPEGGRRKPDGDDGFRHDALLYGGDREFLDGTVPFIGEALAANEAVMVVVGRDKIELLRSALGRDADRVAFSDMAVLGSNPARLIPAVDTFVSEHARRGTNVRCLGEPVWPGRTEAELTECHRHESLVNLAFAETGGLWLRCLYDTVALAPTVVEAVERTHPLLVHEGRHVPSDAYAGLAAAAAPFAEPLPEPDETRSLPFDRDSLAAVRYLVTEHARAAGLEPVRVRDLVLAVHEVAANSVRHAGGEGLLRVWREEDALVCEVRDRGRIDQPLAGRRPPAVQQLGGYGLWLVNQLCDLAQVRAVPTGTAVRMRMRVR